jgi:hypothetical protein
MIRVRYDYDRKEPKKPGSSRLFASMPQSQKNAKTQVASPACWAIAFSSEVGTGARKENASRQKALVSPFKRRGLFAWVEDFLSAAD